MPAITTTIQVADEVFIAAALLHRENPDREDFTVQEIVGRAKRENVNGQYRPGVEKYAYEHAVANRPPSPGKYRVLYATGKNTRRLFRPGDEAHIDRDLRIMPDPMDIPAEYRPLIDWARSRFGENPPPRWLGGVLGLRGTGKDLWQDEDPDQYVRSLREGWE
jgi:hypothetical protein